MSPDKPLISVIIPCYKMGDFVGDALASIQQQTYSTWEIVGVDDCGPEDGTQEIVAKFASQNPQHRVEWIRHEQNRGVSAARNTAIRAARGEWLAFLDPDDLWHRDHLERSVEAFRQDPALAASAAPAWIIYGNDRQFRGEIEFFRDWERELFPHGLGLRNGFALSGVIVGRQAIAGGVAFDETPELQHVEDWDLWLRLVEEGVRFHLHAEPSCYYRKHDGAATTQGPKMRQRLQALYRKHRSLLSEMNWVGQIQLIHRIEQQEKQLRSLRENPVDLPSRAYRWLRRRLTGQPASPPPAKTAPW